MLVHSFVFDLGGTYLRVGLTNGRRLLTPGRQPAPRTYHALLQSLRAGVTRLSGTKKLTAVAGGVAGPLDRKKTGLLGSTHLPYLIRQPLQRDLQRLLHAPVSLENDNALAGLGEATRGAGKGFSIVAYIGIGTGIGGSRIVDGRIDANARGFEPGHHYVNVHVKRRTHASAHPGDGDWESFVSGSAVALQYGTRPEQIKERRIWKELADRIAVGLVNVTMFWSPDVIVVGGSLMQSVSLQEVRRQYKRKQKIFSASPVIKAGELGDFAGLYGAMELLRHRKK